MSASRASSSRVHHSPNRRSHSGEKKSRRSPSQNNSQRTPTKRRPYSREDAPTDAKPKIIRPYTSIKRSPKARLHAPRAQSERRPSSYKDTTHALRFNTIDEQSASYLELKSRLDELTAEHTHLLEHTKKQQTKIDNLEADLDGDHDMRMLLLENRKQKTMIEEANAEISDLLEQEKVYKLSLFLFPSLHYGFHQTFVFPLQIYLGN